MDEKRSGPKRSTVSLSLAIAPEGVYDPHTLAGTLERQ